MLEVYIFYTSDSTTIKLQKQSLMQIVSNASSTTGKMTSGGMFSTRGLVLFCVVHNLFSGKNSIVKLRLLLIHNFVLSLENNFYSDMVSIKIYSIGK